MKVAAVSACILALALAGCGSPKPPPPNPDLTWHAPVEMLKKYVTNADGSLTRAQMDAGLKRDFDAADINHDGCLDKDEARAVNEARWKEDASAASPLVDWNGDGCIDFTEFGMTQRSLFDQLDPKGTGVLTREQLMPHGQAHEKPQRPSIPDPNDVP